MSVESYAHLMAKQVFAGWLRDIAREACGGDDCEGNPAARFDSIYWRVNRDGPHFGVWIEYPFGRPDQIGCRDGYDPVWDEDCGDGLTPLSLWDQRPPTFGELVASGRPPEFIADIVIQHKGSITHAVEVFHKHPVHDRKVEAFYNLGIKLLTPPTSWILGQVRRPDRIPGEFWMGGP